MENKPLMRVINERADMRRAARTKRRTARHQSKIMTTKYNTPDDKTRKQETDAEGIIYQTVTPEGTGIKKDASKKIELTGDKKTDQAAYDKTHGEVVGVDATEVQSDAVRKATTTTSGDFNKYGEQHFDVAKIYKGIGDKYDVRQKASMTKTTPADKSFAGGVTSNTGTQLNIKKYTKAGVIKRDKTFETKGSGWRDEGGAGDTRVSEDREKGVKYISQKRMDRKSSRFINKYNKRAGYGSANLAQGGESTSGDRSSAVSGVNLTAEQRKEKAISDKSRENTYAKKKAAATISGTSGTTSRFVERRKKKEKRKNK